MLYVNVIYNIIPLSIFKHIRFIFLKLILFLSSNKSFIGHFRLELFHWAQVFSSKIIF